MGRKLRKIVPTKIIQLTPNRDKDCEPKLNKSNGLLIVIVCLICLSCYLTLDINDEYGSRRKSRITFSNNQPRSYIVKTEPQTLIRNRKHLRVLPS